MHVKKDILNTPKNCHWPLKSYKCIHEVLHTVISDTDSLLFLRFLLKTCHFFLSAKESGAVTKFGSSFFFCPAKLFQSTLLQEVHEE